MSTISKKIFSCVLLYTPRQATISQDPCNTRVPQHHLWAEVSQPEALCKGASPPGIAEGMAGDSSKTCTKSSQSAISLTRPAWLGREECLVRLNAHFTCGQIYKYMGQNKPLGAAVTALLALW